MTASPAVLQIWDKDGQLGTVTHWHGALVGSDPVMQQLADRFTARYGSEAFSELAQLDNGYVQARAA